MNGVQFLVDDRGDRVCRVAANLSQREDTAIHPERVAQRGKPATQTEFSHGGNTDETRIERVQQVRKNSEPSCPPQPISVVASPCFVRVSSVAKKNLRGARRNRTSTLVEQSPIHPIVEPVQGSVGSCRANSGCASQARRPWAVGCNAFGVRPSRVAAATGHVYDRIAPTPAGNQGRSRDHALCWLVGCVLTVAMIAPAVAESQQSLAELRLTLRSRVETSAGSGRFHAVAKQETWNPKQTAVIVCDMWDRHHCLNATKRGGEVAPRMNDVLKNARSRGATIIHAPSSCMEFYANHAGRKAALAVPKSKNLPKEIGTWCYKIPSEEKGAYPIDQTDGGEDDEAAEHKEWADKLAAMGRNPKAPWKRQTDLLEIADGDFISDNGEEIWSLLEQRGIGNVILVGVHTNMCVLGRPFGLRQMAKNGKHVVLMRDMTDTMYNPASAPYVSHFTGTDLIVEHIEKWVCPTVTSAERHGTM